MSCKICLWGCQFGPLHKQLAFWASKKAIKDIQLSGVDIVGLWSRSEVSDGEDPLLQAPGICAVNDGMDTLFGVVAFCLFNAIPEPQRLLLARMLFVHLWI